MRPYKGKSSVYLVEVRQDESRVTLCFQVEGPSHARSFIKLWQARGRRPYPGWHYEVVMGTGNLELLEHIKTLSSFFTETLYHAGLYNTQDNTLGDLLFAWWAWDPLVNLHSFVDVVKLAARLRAMQEFMCHVDDWPPTRTEFFGAVAGAIPESVRRSIFGHLHTDENYSCNCDYCEFRERIKRDSGLARRKVTVC